MKKACPGNLLRRFARSTDGATAIEYGLIGVLIAVVIIGGISAVGTEVSTTYTDIGSAIQDANQ
jgi:pilus assembly protein Flp/PilA